MRSFLSLGILLGAVACGGTVETDPGSTSTIGAGGKTSSTTGANSTGAGPSTSSAGSTSATSGAGGASACTVSTIDLTADNGVPVHYTSICANSWGSNETTSAVAYEFSGGPPPGTNALRLVGCVSAAATSEGLNVAIENATSPGSFLATSITWTDPTGVSWGIQTDQLTFDITTLEPTGGAVDGTFTGSVSHGGNAAHMLTGNFHLCRVSDELTP